jgi:hypothetical protein
VELAELRALIADLERRLGRNSGNLTASIIG